MSEGTIAETQTGQDHGLLRSVFSFPNPANEVAARLLARWSWRYR